MRGIRGGRPVSPEAGMTLVEVLVAMTIFGLFAAAFAPIILQGLVIAQRSAVQVTANQTVGEIIDAVVVETTCTAIAARAGNWSGGVEANGGVHLAVDVVIDACPTAFPDTVHVAVAVTGGDVAARAETLVVVQGS